MTPALNRCRSAGTEIRDGGPHSQLADPYHRAIQSHIGEHLILSDVYFFFDRRLNKPNFFFSFLVAYHAYHVVGCLFHSKA
jgi:hypothetical protein